MSPNPNSADRDITPQVAAEMVNESPEAVEGAMNGSAKPSPGASGEVRSILVTRGIADRPTSAQRLRSQAEQQRSLRSLTQWVVLLAIAIMTLGFVFNIPWLGLAGALVAFVVSLQVVWRSTRLAIIELLTPEQRILTFCIITLVVAAFGLISATGGERLIQAWYQRLDWDAVGALGEVFGALGQILIALLAVYVAYRQYVIEKDLTTQQNRITQQQTIDSYFQGISDLVLDAEGLLEDWPQERAIAEGRTAAILGSVDAAGKAKVIRFLSKSRLLSPLKRDRHLGRAILDGMGGYEEDRDFGIRVIDLGVMLAGADMSGTDLRWTDLSDANLIRANLAGCDLVKTNLCRTILCDADLSGADMMGTRLFYGSLETASPRSRTEIPNYTTGEYTGAVVEGADFDGVKRMDEAQRYYCCAWGGTNTRSTIPGGCDDIPNLLGR